MSLNLLCAPLVPPPGPTCRLSYFLISRSTRLKLNTGTHCSQQDSGASTRIHKLYCLHCYQRQIPCVVVREPACKPSSLCCCCCKVPAVCHCMLNCSLQNQQTALHTAYTAPLFFLNAYSLNKLYQRVKMSFLLALELIFILI